MSLRICQRVQTPVLEGPRVFRGWDGPLKLSFGIRPSPNALELFIGLWRL